LNTNQLIAISGVVILISFSSLTAQARENQSFLTQFQQIYSSLQTYISNYQKEFSQSLGKLEAELNQAIESSVGDLGIPDPLKAGKNIEKVIEKQQGTLLTLDPRIQADNAIKDWNQQYTRGQSESRSEGAIARSSNN
jgi:type II secretory pathway pseudopilin PulG